MPSNLELAKQKLQEALKPHCFCLKCGFIGTSAGWHDGCDYRACDLPERVDHTITTKLAILALESAESCRYCRGSGKLHDGYTNADIEREADCQFCAPVRQLAKELIK